jgi:hypothetical protein
VAQAQSDPPGRRHCLGTTVGQEIRRLIQFDFL